MAAPAGPLFASTTNGQAGSSSSSGGSEQAQPPPPAPKHQQRERVHITRFDGQEAEAGAAAGAGGAGPKPVTCLWYDLEGAGAASSASSSSSSGGQAEGTALAFLEHPGAFYFLGGSRESFVQYVRQELGQPGAAEGSVAEAKVPDLGAEKVCVCVKRGGGLGRSFVGLQGGVGR